jgi:hypothetical protein
MSSNQETMRTSIKAAAVVASASKASNYAARQSTVAAAAITTGFRPGFPSNYSTYAAAVAAAAVQKAIDDASVEMTRQGAEQAAKDLLRSQGEIPF